MARTKIDGSQLIEQYETASSTGIYEVNLERRASALLANTGIGYTFWHGVQGSSLKRTGMVAGILSTVIEGSEIGDLILAASWHSEDPTSDVHLRIRAASNSSGEVRIPYRLSVGSDTAPSYPLHMFGDAWFADSNAVRFRGNEQVIYSSATGQLDIAAATTVKVQGISISNSTVLTTTTNSFTFQDYISVTETDSTNGWLLSLTKTDYHLSQAKTVVTISGIAATANTNTSLTGTAITITDSVTDGNNSISLVGLSVTSYKTGTRPGTVYGVYTILNANSAQTVSDAWAYAGGHVINNSSVVVTNAYCFSGSVSLESGSVTNAIGYKVEAHTINQGTLSNAYGIKLDEQTAGTNNYEIWLSGSGAIFFGSTTAYIYGNSAILTFADTENTGELTLSDLSSSKIVYLKNQTATHNSIVSLSNATTWNVNSAMIKVIKVVTNSTNWNLTLYCDSAGTGGMFDSLVIASGANGNKDILLDVPYIDNESTNRVHLKFVDMATSANGTVSVFGAKAR